MAFYKRYRKVQNDEQVCMQLENMKQKKNEKVEVYHEKLLKLANSLQQKTIDGFLTIVFKSRLQPYLHVPIVGMKKKKLCSNIRK